MAGLKYRSWGWNEVDGLKGSEEVKIQEEMGLQGNSVHEGLN